MKLERQLHKALTELAKRNNSKYDIWYNCFVFYPKKNPEWECFVCEKKFDFIESLNEILQHGHTHLKEHNLLPFA